MRAAGLLLVLVLAKLSMLWGHAPAVTGWSWLAYGWQDAAIALAFAAFDVALRKMGATPRIAWSVYWTLVLYAAINVPVERAVATPLTWPMIRAAGGPLADSMLLYVTLANVALVLLVFTVAATAPLLWRRMPRRLATLAIGCTIAVAVVGAIVGARVDTRGMDRNAVTALIYSGMPRVGAVAGSRDWRSSPFPVNASGDEDLSQFAGMGRGRNVVMISLESTAAQYLSLYGSHQEVMPNLSALARRALVFENAYAVYPESIKGLFSVLCSTFPAFDSQPEEYEKVNCRSVAEVLGDAGYRTAMFHSGRFGYLGMESIIRHRGYQTLEDAGDIGGNHNSSFGVDEPATVARILSWIDALPRGQRFFLTYLPIAGHHPYVTPEGGSVVATDELGQYRKSLNYGDVSLGALIEGLRARGLEDNTAWVIYGDHGEAFGQHQGNYGHTFFLYDENVRVPLLMALPGAMHSQKRVRQVVSLVDLAPTVLDLLGKPAPAQYQGSTMLGSGPRMALFFTDYSLGILGLRDGPWKFLYEIESGREKLFDMERDPQEIADVSAREKARTSRYSQVVHGWSSSQRSYLASLRK